MSSTYEIIDTERNYPVFKHNDLIQRSRFKLEKEELKILGYMISKITADDLEMPEQVFSIADFCRVIEADSDNGGNYEYIKRTLGKLRSRFIWVTQDDGSETTLGWLSSVTISKRSGLVAIKFDEKMKPYLLGLQNNFTVYNLKHTLTMKSKYSIRLYELLKSWLYKKTITFTIDELKRLVDAENFKKFSHLSARVLEPAVTEINKFTDIWVTYELFKEGRKYTQIKFDIRETTSDENWAARVALEKARKKNNKKAGAS